MIEKIAIINRIMAEIVLSELLFMVVYTLPNYID